MDTTSQEVLGKATARLAHEIKNSLTGIVGALEVLQRNSSPSRMHQKLYCVQTQNLLLSVEKPSSR